MTNQKRGRDVLPIPDRAYTGLIKSKLIQEEPKNGTEPRKNRA